MSYMIHDPHSWADEVDATLDPYIIDEFYDLLDALEAEPYPGASAAPGILDLKGFGIPGRAYTAPFDHGLLAYAVPDDQPVVILVRALWVDDDSPDPALV